MHREDSSYDFFPELAAMEPATAPGMSKSESELNFDLFIQKLTGGHEEDVTLTNLDESKSDDVVVIENARHDDHSNVCASSTALMSKSQLELEQEMFMEQELMAVQEGTLSKPEESDSDNDVVVVIENPKHHSHQHPAAPLAPPPIDLEENSPTYILNQLILACDAFKARNWGSSSEPQNLSHVTQPAKPSQWGTTTHGIGHGVSMAQSEAQTSGSLTIYSTDGELEGNTNTTTYLDLEEAKRAKRLQSNRESAKRSRKKQDEFTSEIIAKADNIKNEYLSLQRSRTYHVLKLEEIIANVRNLKDEVEKLSAQLAEKQKEVQSMPFVSNPTNVAAPMQPNHNQFFYQPVPTISGSSYPNTPVPIVGNPPINVGGNNTAVTSSIQQAASLEHGQEWTGFGTTPSPNWYMPGWD